MGGRVAVLPHALEWLGITPSGDRLGTAVDESGADRKADQRDASRRQVSGDGLCDLARSRYVLEHIVEDDRVEQLSRFDAVGKVAGAHRRSLVDGLGAHGIVRLDADDGIETIRRRSEKPSVRRSDFEQPSVVHTGKRRKRFENAAIALGTDRRQSFRPPVFVDDRAK
jgi:hypothetical protein